VAQLSDWPRLVHPSVELFMEKGPMIYLKDDLKKDYPDHPYYPYMKQKIMIGGPLINAGKPIGTLFFLSMDENAYSHEDFTLFKAISDQLAVAVSNVLAHEQLLEEKHISETLLSIGEGIATLRSKKDLINYIVDKLKPLFGFHDTGIIILDQHKEKYTDWSIQYTINTSEKSNKVFSYYEDPSGWNPVKNSSVAYIINEIDKTNKPTVFEWNGDWDHFSDNKLLSFSRGYDQSMVYLLKTGNVVLGTFWMNYQKGFDLNQLSLPLFQGICDQLAVAISNILANEQILEEKKLTEQLLEITESIAQIQDAYTLFKVIKERVQPIFDFELFDIVLLMEDNYSVVYYDPEEVHPDTVDFFENTISIDGSPFEEYFEKHPDTLIASIDDWLEKYPNYKGLQLVKKQGYSHLLLHKLHYKGELLGCIEMGYNQKPMLTKERIDLLNNFTQQVVLSVVNILSNENLVNEKRTTETLLSISEGISYIRSKKELLSYIIEKLKPIFNFYDTGILVLDKEKKQYTDWSAFYQVDDSPANLGIFDHYENQTIWNPYAGSGVELTIMESDKTSQPIIFDWNKDWSHLSDSKIMVFLKGHDYDRSMVYPFKNGSELLGAFWINFRKKDNIDQVSKPLFQGISDQLAVTISNILANEEIERRERLKSLQVETVSIFNQDKDWDERFEEFIKALQPHIPFHFASIDLWDDAADYNRCKNIERIGSNEYRLWGQDDFERASGVTKKESSSAYSIARNWHFEERKTPVSQSKAHKTILKILNKIMDIEQHIDLSIALQGDRRFLLSLYKKGTAPYNSEQASLLQELSDSLGQTIEKALIAEKVNELNQQLVEEKAYLQEEVKETYGFEEIVGKSEVMQKVFEKVSEVSAINATVLILGETGTGKELIARAIHNSSPRRDRVLVKVNCAAIPSQIVESELFGHEKGAFTGAIKQRVGKFELANHGTIFLDEIGDMPMELQAKLLRVLQEREVERVGSNTMIKLDFRVISATNKNLEELVAAGKFRADLFYRLNTFPLYLPALREREKDSELLAKHFARQFSQSLGLPFKGFSKKSLHNISTYEWPGNVRELQNVIEQAMILQKDKKLDISPHRAEKIGGTRSASAGLREIPDEFDMEYINAQKENLEKEYLMHVLEKTKWRVRGKGGAAELLDVHPNSLDYYLKKLGISKK
ncbi:MAG: sigma 54-interacting transcriptional regulator, partial [Bacteroidota bacterium]